MMENNIEPTLDDVLNTFVQENDRPTAGNLQEWVERYPQFRKDLIDFAAAWAEQLVLPEAEEIAAETEKLLVDRAMSHVHNVAYSRDLETLRETTTDDPVHSLTGDAHRVGTEPAELARVCRLDLGLLSKLNSRQIQPWTIPAELIGMLAEQLNKTVAALTIFFAGPPRAAIGKAYLSRGKPTASPQQSFAEAVQQSSLSDEEKARWLSEETAERV